VDTHPNADLHPYRPLVHRDNFLGFCRSSNRGVCRPEGNEERIAFAVDLVAAVRVEGGTETRPVLVEEIGVGIARAVGAASSTPRCR
jgi:hypothetical protein